MATNTPIKLCPSEIRWGTATRLKRCNFALGHRGLHADIQDGSNVWWGSTPSLIDEMEMRNK